MKLAFYKAFQPKATWIDNTIAIFSGGKYSHVEIVFPDGECFSISARDGKGRFKNIPIDNDRWDILEIYPAEPKRIREDAEEFEGYKYDYLGAIFSVAPFCFERSTRIFCSEVITNILRRYPSYSFLEEGCNYSPSRLYKELECMNIK